MPPFTVAIITDVKAYLNGHDGDEVRLVDYETGGTIWLAECKGVFSTPHYFSENRMHIVIPWLEDTTEGFQTQHTNDADWDIYVSGYLLQNPP